MSKANHDTRAKLVAEGLKSMIVNGYDGIGLNAILDAAAVPKGSFYYFFKSKEEFAAAVLEAYERHYVELRDVILNDVSVSPLQRLRNYFDEVERIHLAETPLGGCLYGVLGQTARARTPQFRAKLAAVFSSWEKQLQGLLKQAQLAGEIDPSINPKDAAAFLIDAYEGMLIRTKVDGNKKAFNRFKTFAIDSLSR
ncbi:TetR family transcriptional regulator C-terminal domain-containing protein [Paraburkholderia agricolaris]|jgi:TetR/AcrR family transcriptional repressor of nem operon|uniref:TetR family transcriptional regulator C-terminal domain-containing protein n=1 Tax=Paraburkholderia agricolaris TaxID=2152888 RepID=A0ABW8ZTF3_9BURK|nr:TetR/AcrR family transcriptional regulator [Paraburkholderia agricolaris]